MRDAYDWPMLTLGTVLAIADAVWITGWERRTLHDLASRSRVVDDRAPAVVAAAA